jgi:hypothetical protein
MKAPKKYVFTKVLSHRAFEKIRQMNVEYVSLYSFGEKRSASSSNILISEKDYEKIKNIKGVSSAKDTINGNDWLARNESEKLKKIFRNMNSKYKQGGKIDRAALVDTNTAIATKNKLKKNFDLPFEVAVYVPSTSDANKNISKQDFEKRINEVREYLANVFGGFSSNEVSGGYVSSEKGLIKEGVHKVTSFASKENLDSNMKKLISQIKKWCKDWSQESIGLEFEGDLYYLSETAEYKNGGIMYAQGGDIIDLFDKYELINLIKTYDFKSVDVSNMETISYSKSGNPFDKFDVGTIKLSPLVRDYHDSLLIVIDKQKGKYVIRIGADTGWTGGLEKSSVELTFDIPKLTFEEFKKGFLNATINQNYCLVSKYGTGNIDTIHFQGNLQEIKDYALENGYELKENSSPSIFDFYFYKKDLPLWRNDRLLQVYVLSSQQIDNITERNEGSKYAQGGDIETTFTYQIGGL